MRTATSSRTASNAKDSDQPFAAVIKDLKSRGLLKDTLVVCGSEFGRTPVREVGGGGGNVKRGRDHNPFGFTMWLAGGGVKGGTIYGATDDFGFKAVEKPVARARPARDHPASARHRSHQADLPLQRPRLPADRRRRQRASRDSRVIEGVLNLQVGVSAIPRPDQYGCIHSSL